MGEVLHNGQSASSLPTGTVTFLFTDIEGSTRLWDEYPDAMRDALIRHDDLIELCVTQHAGVIVRPRGEGDSRFAVFSQASDAVAAACTIQWAMHAELWGTPTPLKVRMALHTGEIDVRAGDYYGSEVNRCARLRSVAHGGQTVLSLVTMALARATLPLGVQLRDLGEHRLKDLNRPEQVFQLVIPGVPADFPPLASLDHQSTNLPVQPTPLIGREREVMGICDLLRQPNVRLLTLTGSGGTGKTRLALQAAAELSDEFDDGVFFVPLASIDTPSLVAVTIAQALGVQELSSHPLRENLLDFVAGRQLLLLLDNFEQVVDAAPLIADMIQVAPRLKILVTSREILRITAEHEIVVPPLMLPCLHPLPPLAELRRYEAIRLFCARAQAVKSTFAITAENAGAVAAICVRLDGLPLAIELAAVRVKMLAPQNILDRLDLSLLADRRLDRPARQQTLRAAIAWSYDLLDHEEQSLFARMGVFVGGCS